MAPENTVVLHFDTTELDELISKLDTARELADDLIDALAFLGIYDCEVEEVEIEDEGCGACAPCSCEECDLYTPPFRQTIQPMYPVPAISKQEFVDMFLQVLNQM